MSVLTKLDPVRCSLGMEAQDAEQLAKRVALHLYRGSIDHAREALEDGWRAHLAGRADLPTGRQLLDEPLSVVIENPRLVNILERYGLLTVGQLLAESDFDLRSMAGLGDKHVAYLLELGANLRDRCGGAKLRGKLLP